MPFSNEMFVFIFSTHVLACHMLFVIFSGLLCLINTYDRCSALHRAIEGNQFKLIPLLLAADPNIVNIQDKNGQSALHRACHQNLKKCILALCVSHAGDKNHVINTKYYRALQLFLLIQC